MRRMLAIGVMLVALGMTAQTTRAQSSAPGVPGNAAEQSFVQQHQDQWSQLTPDQRETVLQNYRKWQSMTPEERGAAQRNFQEFHRLPPEERRRAMESLHRWRNLPEAQRRQL